MKIVYLGSGEFGIESLNALIESSHQLKLVVTGAASPAGRGRKPKPTSVAEWAKSHSIEFIETGDVNSADIVKKIAAAGPELIVVIAFGQKVSSELTGLPPKGAINVHASLLPKYRGSAPINRAIVNGESETGISIITVAEKIDAGDILAQSATEIRDGESAGELHDRLAKMAAPVLLATIDKIADSSVVYTKQDDSKVTLAPKLKKSDGFIDFGEPAEVVRRKILGFWPWPGASVIYNSKKTGKTCKVTIATAEVVENSNPVGLPIGTLDDDLNIICGANTLRISKIKPDGSRLMDFADFVNGQHSQPGDKFKKIEK